MFYRFNFAIFGDDLNNVKSRLKLRGIFLQIKGGSLRHFFLFRCVNELGGSMESGEKLNALAVLISFATTELSFGAIALSSFAPVHIFGTAVFVGLFAALFGSMFFRRN